MMQHYGSLSEFEAQEPRGRRLALFLDNQPPVVGAVVQSVASALVPYPRRSQVVADQSEQFRWA